jgi:hypothetical protein
MVSLDLFSIKCSLSNGNQQNVPLDLPKSFTVKYVDSEDKTLSITVCVPTIPPSSSIHIRKMTKAGGDLPI